MSGGVRPGAASALALVMASAAALTAAGCRRAPELHGAVLEPPRPAADFTLTDQHGAPFTLSAARGKVVLLYFGFTSCPDICPTTLAEVKAALVALGDDARRVQVAVVTVDAERDTPERLATYLAAFDPSFLGLTGSAAALSAVYSDYGITIERRELPNSALGYTIDHTASLSMIDARGMVRELILHGTPPEHIAADLAVLLAEPAT